MNIVDRIKNILLKPKEEWLVIEQETTSVNQLLTTYLLILALIPALGQFVRFGFIGYHVPFMGHMHGTLSIGLRYAVMAYLSSILAVFISAYVIDFLAPNFNSEKNFVKAFQMVVYAYTPVLVAGIFYFIPGLSFLTIFSLYGIYILYLGFHPMMKTPEDKVSVYFVVSILVVIAVYIIIGIILGILFGLGSMAGGMAGMSAM